MKPRTPNRYHGLRDLPARPRVPEAAPGAPPRRPARRRGIRFRSGDGAGFWSKRHGCQCCGGERNIISTPMPLSRLKDYPAGQGTTGQLRGQMFGARCSPVYKVAYKVVVQGGRTRFLESTSYKVSGFFCVQGFVQGLSAPAGGKGVLANRGWGSWGIGERGVSVGW